MPCLAVLLSPVTYWQFLLMFYWCLDPALIRIGWHWEELNGIDRHWFAMIGIERHFGSMPWFWFDKPLHHIPHLTRKYKMYMQYYLYSPTIFFFRKSNVWFNKETSKEVTLQQTSQQGHPHLWPTWYVQFDIFLFNRWLPVCMGILIFHRLYLK